MYITECTKKGFIQKGMKFIQVSEDQVCKIATVVQSILQKYFHKIVYNSYPSTSTRLSFNHFKAQSDREFCRSQTEVRTSTQSMVNYQNAKHNLICFLWYEQGTTE